MTNKVNSIINELNKEVNQKKILIRRLENNIKVLSNECVERLRIIEKLKENEND